MEKRNGWRLLFFFAAIGSIFLATVPAEALGGGYFVDHTFLLPQQTNVNTGWTALGDVDGDGDLDVVVGRGGGPPEECPDCNQDLVWINQGLDPQGLPIYADETAARRPPDPEQTFRTYLVDLDGDGDLDIFSGQANVTIPSLLINNGAGQFTDQSASRLPPNSSCNYASFGDIDGDGDLDIVSVEGGRFLILINGTNELGEKGYFTDETSSCLPENLPVGFQNLYHAAVILGDADGDGDLDLFYANDSPDGGAQNHLFLNDGTGEFADGTGTWLPSRMDKSSDAAFVDVDGDTDLDLVVFNISDGSRLLINRRIYSGGTPENRFADETDLRMPTDLNTFWSGTVTDVNGDHNPDIISGGRLLMNDGFGYFTDETASRVFPVGGLPPGQASVGDINGDTLPDLFGQNLSTSLYLNRLDPPPPPPPPAGDYEIAFFHVQHRVYEDGRDFNRAGFGMRTAAGELPVEDVVSGVTLYDPEGQPVMSDINLDPMNYSVMNGRYDDMTGQWLYDGVFSNENYYRMNIAGPLKTGTYRLEVRDINGVLYVRNFQFNGELALPVISATTFESGFEGSNFVFKWAAPDLTDVSVPASIIATLSLYNENGYAGELRVRVPALMGYALIPKWVMQQIKAEANEYSMQVRLQTNDNNNRTYSNEVPPDDHYLGNRFVQRRLYEDGSEGKRLMCQFFNPFGDLVPVADVMNSPSDPVILGDPDGYGVGLSGQTLWSWNVAYGRYDGMGWYIDPGFHYENGIIATIEDDLVEGPYVFSVPYKYGGTVEGAYAFNGIVDLPIVGAASFETFFDGAGNFVWAWDASELVDLDPTQISVQANLQLFAGGNYLGEYMIRVPPQVDHIVIPETLLAGATALNLQLQIRTNDNNNRAYSNRITLPLVGDADSDGISDIVDSYPGAFSNTFSDGTTDGTILDRADQVVTVTDAPEPEGVVIAASVGTSAASVSVCDGATVLHLDDGDEIVVTCGSVISRVTKGKVEVTLIGSDGTEATTFVEEGNGFTFEPDTFTITVPETNTQDLVVEKDGQTVVIAPNESKRIITIDIKPGSDPNSVNLGSRGVVPVALLTAAGFDAPQEVAPDTVRFAGAEAERWQACDVDGDGDLDLLFHFRTQDLDLDEESTAATLSGETSEGAYFEGVGAVNIVPKGNGKKK